MQQNEGCKCEVGTREDDVRKISKEYFEDLYNIYIQKQVAVPMCAFDGIRRGNYFRGEPIGRAEAEVRVGKLKNIIAAAKKWQK